MMETAKPALGTITLIGSGEMSARMGAVHRALMSRIAAPVQPVFLDTPAGFQLNADQLSVRAVAYFQRRFGLDLSVASFKAAATATPDQVEVAVRRLQAANYIFAGPGSPTYAVRNWLGTPIPDTLADRLAAAAHLVFASAAAIAVGRYALPVYEIYKVGEEAGWVDGLDLLGPYGLELAIVPHWNNAEGGTHDTRYCFLGRPRLALLEGRLPDSAAILGIDEYTACILDLSRRTAEVMGVGQVTLRRHRQEATYPAGAHFSLERLSLPSDLPEPVAPVGAQPADQLPLLLPDQDSENPGDDESDAASLVDLLVTVRAQLRAARNWELADEIRQRLAELGYLLDDGPSDTHWRTA